MVMHFLTWFVVLVFMFCLERTGMMYSSLKEVENCITIYWQQVRMSEECVLEKDFLKFCSKYAILNKLGQES